AAGDAVLFHDLAPVAPDARCRRVEWRIAGDDAMPVQGGLLTTVVEARTPNRGGVVGVRIDPPARSSGHAALGPVAVPGDRQAAQPVPGARRVDQWGWAGRTLFRDSAAFVELQLPPTSTRHIRVELTSPDTGGRSPVERVCVQRAPAT